MKTSVYKKSILAFCCILLFTGITSTSKSQTQTESNSVNYQAVSNTATSTKEVMSSYEFSQQFGRGWNVGNSLEATGGETNWGNPLITQQLIDSVAAAGFSSIRIPVAWSVFSDENDYTIDADWLNRVEEVVNYALDNDMYVIMNEHWDGGWLQPTYENQDEGNARLAALWEQIAEHFINYDDRLVFAGTNEVMVEGDYSAPSEEYYTVQNGFNQTFVSTVRATGGNNATRYLAVQGFNTNINYTESFFVMPEDAAENKLIVEVHYYDPYDFTINENSTVYTWGNDAPDSQSWANESYADSQFKKMKTLFVDNNIGVIIGEYGAIARLNLGSANNEMHAMYREYYIKYITHSIVKHGLIPIYWDNGYTSNNAFGLFNRSTGEQAYPEIIKAIIDTSNVQSPNPNSINNAITRTFSVYPNPAQETVNIQCNGTQQQNIELYNASGQLIDTWKVTAGINVFNIEKLNAGIYIINTKTNEHIYPHKFIKE